MIHIICLNCGTKWASIDTNDLKDEFLIDILKKVNETSKEYPCCDNPEIE